MLKCSCAFDHEALAATLPQPMQKCSSSHRFKLLQIRSTRVLIGQFFLLYITYPDSTVTFSVQNSSRAHRYVYINWLLVQTQVSLLRWSVRSFGIRSWSSFPYRTESGESLEYPEVDDGWVWRIRLPVNDHNPLHWLHWWHLIWKTRGSSLLADSAPGLAHGTTLLDTRSDLE